MMAQDSTSGKQQNNGKSTPVERLETPGARSIPVTSTPPSTTMPSITPATIDFAALGLKVGLEIHQQVGRKGDHKLFCNCPVEMTDRQPDVVVERKLRASAGETGTTDAAAAAEQAKGKSYCYQAFNEVTCLVELDEEPPHAVNQEVITTAVMVAKACESTILPRVQFMRKTIVDGSATSGFQRTGLFALGGTLPDVAPPVRLQTICVEEDAAQITVRTANSDTYNLSRLGIPLIEIATDPDIISPQHAYDSALQIGMILRSTKRVKRGIGTIRQDVNISIAGGNRVEIKGCQELRLIPTYVEYESIRQRTLLLVKAELAKRGASAVHISKTIDVTEIFRTSTAGFIKSALGKGDHAVGMSVPHFAGLLGRELCPNYRVGSELADIARTQGFGGLIHSDEDLKKYGFADPSATLAALHGAFNRGPPHESSSHSTQLSGGTSHGGSTDDAFILLIGDTARIEQLFKGTLSARIAQFSCGVPKEVRKPNPDGTTSPLRTMPGAARMYPETDVPIVIVNTEGIAAPKLFTEQVKDLVNETHISEDQARLIVKEGIPFDEYLQRFPSIDATFIATCCLSYGKEILARYKKEIDHIALLEPLLDAVERKKIPKSAVFEILVEIAEGKTSIHAIDYAKYAPLDPAILKQIVRDAIKELPNASPNVLMGKVMAQARGKTDGKTVMQLIEEEKRLLL